MIVSAAAKAGLQFWTVPAVAEECVGHLLNVRAMLPSAAYRQIPEVRFAFAFFRIVQLWPLTGNELLAAALRLRSVQREHPGVTRRRLPSLADALFAHAAKADPDVRLVVTDDAHDFRQVAPEFAGRVLSVQEVIQALGG